MKYVPQQTVAKDVMATGIGLHSGKPVRLRLCPAEPNTGIIFRRVDHPEAADIPVCAAAVTDTKLCTQLGDQTTGVSTVEHLLAALFALGIDNLRIEVDAPEVPIFDGSAAPFIFLLQTAGIALQEAPKKAYKVLREIRVEDGDKFAQLSPADGFSVDLIVDYNHPVIPHQQQRFTFVGRAFQDEIARARTFCFQKDLEMLQTKGLARGGGLDNAIVIKDYSILNPTDLRYPDEFLRHKVLDVVGDLYLGGHLILGAFSGRKTGHALNNKLLRTLLAEPSNYRLVELPADTDGLPYPTAA